MKSKSIPSAREVREALSPLSGPQMERLASKSGVPFHTIYKIQRGETVNPRLDTVRAIWPLIPEAVAKQAA